MRVYLVEPPLPCAGHADPILDSFPEWEQLGRTEPERRARWRRKVRGEQPAKELDGLRSSVRSGRPYGAEDWVEVISHRLGIVREPRRRGRPPREKMLCSENPARNWPGGATTPQTPIGAGGTLLAGGRASVVPDPFHGTDIGAP